MENNLSNRGWNSMEKLLDREMPQQKRSPFFWWWGSVGAVVILLLFSMYYYSSLWGTKEFFDPLEESVLSKVPSEDIVQSNQESLYPLGAKATNSSSKGLPFVQADVTFLASSNVDKEQVIVAVSPIESSQFKAKYREERTLQTSADKSAKEQELAEQPIEESASHKIEMETTLNIDEFSDEKLIAQTDTKKETRPLVKADKGIIDVSPDQSKGISSELDIKSQSTRSNFYINPSAGLGLSNPAGFAAQFSGGITMPLFKNWAFMSGLGLGFNEFRKDASVGLVRSSGIQFNSVNEESSFGLGIPDGSEVANLQLSSYLSAFLEAGIMYRYNSWMVQSGVLVVRRFDIKESSLRQSELNFDGQMARLNYTPAEIKEIFELYNRWDVRPTVAVGYALNTNYSVSLSYQHGLSPFMRYPVNRDDQAYTRLLMLGFMYQW